MKTHFVRLMLATLVTLGLAIPARADGVNPKQVSATAKWVAHMDFDAGRATEGGKHLREKFLASDHGKRAMERMKTELGFNPETDLHSATVYGDKLVPGNGVLLINAKADKDKIVEQLNKKKSVKTSKHGDYTLYSWVEQPRHADKDKKDDKGSKDAHHAPWDMPHTVFACIDHKGVVVITHSEDALKAALDVLDGKSGSIAADSPLVAAGPEGTVLMIRAAGLSDIESLFKNPVVKQMQTLSFTAGEHSGQSFMHSSVTTTTEDAAKQVEALINGAKALGQLRHVDKPDTLEMLNKVKITRDDKTVKVDAEAAAADVIKLAEAEGARMKDAGEKAREAREKVRKAIKERLEERKSDK